MSLSTATALFYRDNLITIYHGDARNMAELPDESVQCVITSPPYWGLRKYAGDQELVWGGNGDCEHQWGKPLEVGDNRFRGEHSIVGSQKNPDITSAGKMLSQFCSLCGAWHGSFGLEPTPEAYVSHSIEFLREIRRVLRKDGVVFWNIGDSYAGSNSGKGDYREKKGLQKDIYDYNHPQAKAGKWDKWRRGIGGEEHGVSLSGIPIPLNLKPKDLCLIPFRVAIAAQNDGWWVRSVIIWSKPNPMPESVTDRPTESHEYILMLTKSGTTQYWTHRDGIGGIRQRPKPDYRWVNRMTNMEVAVEPLNWKEKITCPDCEGTGNVDKVTGWYVEEDKCSTCQGKGKTTLWKRINLWKGHDYYWDADAVREPNTEGTLIRGQYKQGTKMHSKRLNDPASDVWLKDIDVTGRNIRTVWEFPTQPLKPILLYSLRSYQRYVLRQPHQK